MQIDNTLPKPWGNLCMDFQRTLVAARGQKRFDGSSRYKGGEFPLGPSSNSGFWRMVVDIACAYERSPESTDYDCYELLRMLVSQLPIDLETNVLARVGFWATQNKAANGSNTNKAWIHLATTVIQAECSCRANRRIQARSTFSQAIAELRSSSAPSFPGGRQLIEYLVARTIRLTYETNEDSALSAIEKLTTSDAWSLQLVLDHDFSLASPHFKRRLSGHLTLVASTPDLVKSTDDVVPSAARHIADQAKTNRNLVYALTRAWSSLDPESANLATLVREFCTIQSRYAPKLAQGLDPQVRVSSRAEEYRDAFLKAAVNLLISPPTSQGKSNDEDHGRRVTECIKAAYQFSPPNNMREAELSNRMRDLGGGERTQQFMDEFASSLHNPHLQERLDVLRNNPHRFAWITSNDCDREIVDPRHRPFRSHKPCNLEAVKILLWAVFNDGQEVVQAYENGQIGGCPVHRCTALGIDIFLREMFTNAQSGSFSAQGVALALELTRDCHPFSMTQRVEDFLTSDGALEVHVWQRRALQSWAAHGRRGVISAATGAGKSLVGAAALLEGIEAGFAGWLFTHRRVLKDQWTRKVFKLPSGVTQLIPGLKLGPVKQLDPSTSASDDKSLKPRRGELLVTLPISYRNREHLAPSEGDPNIVLVDEVHNFASFFAAHQELGTRFSRKLGMSATIDIRDQEVLNALGEEVFDYQISHAIEDGTIARFRLLCIRYLSDGVAAEVAEEALTKARDNLAFWQRELSQTNFKQLDGEDYFHAVNRAVKDRNLDYGAIALKVAHAKGAFDERTGDSQGIGGMYSLAPFLKSRGHALIFSNSRDTGWAVAEQLKALGVATQYLDGEDSMGTRRKYIELLESEELHALVAPEILDEGIDIPSARTAIILGVGAYGYRQVLQRAGRVLRTHESGDTPTIIIMALIGGSDDPQVVKVGTSFGELAKHTSDVELYTRTVDLANEEDLESAVQWAFS